MGKVLKPVIAIAALAVPVIGPALGLGALAALGVSAALTVGSSLIKSKGSVASRADRSRLEVTLNPTTPRLMVFGHTAGGSDLWYQSYTGADQEYLNWVIVNAAHPFLHEQIWIDSKLAWTAGGGVQAPFAGYLDVVTREAGSAANMVDIDSVWCAAEDRRLTGCAYVWLRFKLTGTGKKAESPFASSVSRNLRFVGQGCPFYDPRKDSTRGGLGTQRADDQTTWAREVSGNGAYRNRALAELAWLLGWRIGGAVSCGRGMDPARIDFASHITAANQCDESAALAAGGTEKRYLFDGIWGEDQGGDTVLAGFCEGMAGSLNDVNGRLALRIAHNDLALPVMAFTDDDVIGEFNWEPVPDGLEADRNIARGRYTDPRDAALYQPNEAPAVSIAQIDGTDRTLNFEPAGVQSPAQWQRLAMLKLLRQRTNGRFTATFKARAWAVGVDDVVTQSFKARRWTDKLFRVEARSNERDGTSRVVLREEFDALYPADGVDAAPIALAAVTGFDPINNPMITPVPDDADHTADQVIVSRLNESNGQALSSFIAEDGRTFAKLAEVGEARDGDVVNFTSTLPGVPNIVLGPGGNAPTAGRNVRIRAEGVTTSGFTLIAKEQVVTAGATITDASASAGSGAEPALVINRTDGGTPVGGFTFDYSVTVGDIGPGEPGNLRIGLFVKQSGSWQQVGGASHNASGSYSVVVYPGAVDFGSGNEFGVSKLSGEGTGTALSSFDQVSYTLGSVVETTLTPAGASAIPWQAYLQ